MFKWLAYDQAFRQHTAVTKLVDWSTMNIQLYNFHAVGASVHSGSGGSLNELPEPSGADSSQVICRSVVEQGPLFGTINLLRVGSSIAAALERVLTMRRNASIVLTKHLHTIPNADLLLLPLYLRLPRKPGVCGRALLFS